MKPDDWTIASAIPEIVSSVAIAAMMGLEGEQGLPVTTLEKGIFDHVTLARLIRRERYWEKIE